MAVTINPGIEYSRTSEYRFLPENIEVRAELNGRLHKPNIEDLIADIVRYGQHTCCLFWSDAGTPVLAAGFSRWRAVSEINKRKLTPKPLELRCTYIKCNEQGAFLRNISENRMRTPASPIDDAHNISKLIENWQMDEKEVAKIYFPTAETEEELKEALKFVRSRLELVKLTPEAERAMRNGRLDETAAQAIAKLTSAQQREALVSKEGKLSAKDIKAAAPKSTRAKKTPKIDPELRRRITAVIETADFDNYYEKKPVWIEVNAYNLVALKNYINEK